MLNKILELLFRKPERRIIHVQTPEIPNKLLELDKQSKKATVKSSKISFWSAVVSGLALIFAVVQYSFKVSVDKELIELQIKTIMQQEIRAKENLRVQSEIEAIALYKGYLELDESKRSGALVMTVAESIFTLVGSSYEESPWNNTIKYMVSEDKDLIYTDSLLKNTFSSDFIYFLNSNENYCKLNLQ